MLSRITIVLARWCSHSIPLSIDAVKKIGNDLNIPVRILDIDNNKDEKIADELIKKNGNYSEDYRIPQVFLEYHKGDIKHIFIGSSQGVSESKKKWEEFFSSDFYKKLLNNHFI
jgi:hypothetical protein